MSKRSFEDDDGRQIADMSGIEMPNDPMLGGLFRKKKKAPPKEEDPAAPAPAPLSKKDARRIALHALLAGLVIGLIFILAAFIFLLFCRYVWLR